MSKMRTGNRTAYKPEFVELVEKRASEGYLNFEIAKSLGVSPAGFSKYLKVYPELKEALDRGRQIPTAKIERALYKRALGYEAEDVEAYIDSDNRLIKARKLKRHIPGDVGAMTFWLKNKKPKVWADKKQLELGGGLNLSVQPLSKEELDKLWETADAEGILKDENLDVNLDEITGKNYEDFDEGSMYGYDETYTEDTETVEEYEL